MPKGRKDEMPTYDGLNGSKIAIKRGSKADKIRIKKTQESYDRGTKINPPVSSRTNLKISSQIGATTAAIEAGYSPKKSKLEKKFK